MQILIAPNAFKNSLDAATVTDAISEGLQESKLSCSIIRFPVADGGDGTGKLLGTYLEAATVSVLVKDPLGRSITSSFGWVEKDKTAIIELADASGLRLLKPAEYDPLHTTTFGTGELINEAIKKDAGKIIICIGGSATVDGAVGILQALGIEFNDADGNTLTGLPESLPLLSKIIIPQTFKKYSNTEFIVLCDVENYLLGVNGAASVFGPQKGASPPGVMILDNALSHLRDIVLQTTGKDMGAIKHGGAAGGVAASLHTFLNATLVNGIGYFLDSTHFENELARADLVITGEGSLDAQTLQGKGPFGVAKKAKQYLLPVIGMAGKISAEKELSEYFDQLITINPAGMKLDEAIAATYSNLKLSARMLGDELSGEFNIV